MSETPVEYEKAAPKLGAETQFVLVQVLGLNETEIEKLRSGKIIG
jgi:crotonobetainyl-CoA:carnitine CoA-transferase CaiB-like acyl-CoA transferase